MTAHCLWTMSITANMFRSRTRHAQSWILSMPRVFTHSPRKNISIGGLTRQYTQQPRQSAEAGSFDNNGLVKHTGQDTATITLPKRAHCQLNDREVDVHYLQLRDACHCPQCVDPQTKQRSFRTSDIPSDIKPQHITWVREPSMGDGEQELLEIAWNKDVIGSENESHVTRLPADDIITPPAHYYRKSVGAGSKKIFWDAHEMKVNQPWINFQDWMNDETLFGAALNKLSLYGLIFLDNIPDSREMVSEIAMRMGPLRNTFYGLTWDVRNDPKAKNVAYTNLNLGFHMDLLYLQNPPGFQLLHCLKNSCEGGESMFVDAFGAARDLDQETWEVLSSHRVPYHYNHKEQYYRTTRPVLELPDTKDESLPDRTLRHVNYSPPFQGPYHISQNESSLWPTKMKKYLAAVRKFEQRIEDPSRIFELKLKPGQCVIFDNRRVLHARRGFDTSVGERWLAGAYVDEDAVHSRMFTLKRNAGEFQTKS